MISPRQNRPSRCSRQKISGGYGGNRPAQGNLNHAKTRVNTLKYAYARLRTDSGEIIFPVKMISSENVGIPTAAAWLRTGNCSARPSMERGSVSRSTSAFQAVINLSKRLLGGEAAAGRRPALRGLRQNPAATLAPRKNCVPTAAFCGKSTR